jgi:hypothetical protein
MQTGRRGAYHCPTFDIVVAASRRVSVGSSGWTRCGLGSNVHCVYSVDLCRCLRTMRKLSLLPFCFAPNPRYFQVSAVSRCQKKWNWSSSPPTSLTLVGRRLVEAEYVVSFEFTYHHQSELSIPESGPMFKNENHSVFSSYRTSRGSIEKQ